LNDSRVYNNSSSWVEKHIRLYVRTDGHEGHIWNGVPTLLITTLGRKSGKRRRTALIYGQDGDRYIVVASQRGHAEHPNWYLNLLEHPQVDVQVLAAKFTAHAYTASLEEKPRLWALMAAIWPGFTYYQSKTEREIPVVVLTPSSE